MKKPITVYLIIFFLASIIAYQFGLRNSKPITNVIQKEAVLTCPYKIQGSLYKDGINFLNEAEITEKPQLIEKPEVVKINKLYNRQEFEKDLYTSSSYKGWDSREFDVTGDGKNETIINANTAMNHTPHVALIVENGNIIFEASGANIWVDEVYEGKGFLLRKTIDWSNKDYLITRYVYIDSGFMPIWTQKVCGVKFE